MDPLPQRPVLVRSPQHAGSAKRGKRNPFFPGITVAWFYPSQKLVGPLGGPSKQIIKYQLFFFTNFSVYQYAYICQSNNSKVYWFCALKKLQTKEKPIRWSKEQKERRNVTMVNFWYGYKRKYWTPCSTNHHHFSIFLESRVVYATRKKVREKSVHHNAHRPRSNRPQSSKWWPLKLSSHSLSFHGNWI